MRKFRFKTKEEFEREFGKDWRTEVHCSFPSHMDFLLGIEIPDNKLEKINSQYEKGRNVVCDYDGYTLSGDMVIPIGLHYKEGMTVIKNGLKYA